MKMIINYMEKIGNNTLFLLPPPAVFFPDPSVRCSCTVGFSICIQCVLEYETRIFLLIHHLKSKGVGLKSSTNLNMLYGGILLQVDIWEGVLFVFPPPSFFLPAFLSSFFLSFIISVGVYVNHIYECCTL